MWLHLQKVALVKSGTHKVEIQVLQYLSAVYISTVEQKASTQGSNTKWIFQVCSFYFDPDASRLQNIRLWQKCAPLCHCLTEKLDTNPVKILHITEKQILTQRLTVHLSDIYKTKNKIQKYFAGHIWVNIFLWQLAQFIPRKRHCCKK